MRHHLLITLLSGALSLPLIAAEQFLTVTPQTMDGWTISGVDRDVIAANQQLVLPGSAQLSREFPASAVILRLVSRPVFSEEAAQWPVVGVGSAGLALIRKEGRGRFMLVLNETTVKELPWSVALDGKEVTVDLVLACDPLSGAVLVAFQDKVQDFAVPLSTRPMEIWLSAGESSAWPQDLMQVMLVTADREAAPARAIARRPASAKQTPADRLQAAAGRLLANAVSGEGSRATPSAGTVRTPEPGAVSTLEVFTPPAVRRARIIEAVRTTVARSQGK